MVALLSVARVQLLRPSLVALAAALLLSLSSSPAAAVYNQPMTMSKIAFRSGTHQELGGIVVVDGGVQADPNRPIAASAHVCLGFDAGGGDGPGLHPADNGGPLVYVDFLGPSGSGGSKPFGNVAGHDIPIPTPAAGWGTWEAGYSESDCETSGIGAA